MSDFNDSGLGPRLERRLAKLSNQIMGLGVFFRRDGEPRLILVFDNYAVIELSNAGRSFEEIESAVTELEAGGQVVGR